MISAEPLDFGCLNSANGWDELQSQTVKLRRVPPLATPPSIQVWVEPSMPPWLDQSIRQLLCACFPTDSAAFTRSRAWHDSSPEYTVVSHDGSLLVGHIGMVVREVLAGMTLTPVVGVQNFCVAAGHRGTGLSRVLMQTALAEATSRQVPFGLLFCIPELERLYVQFGWRSTCESVTMRDEQGNIVAIPDKNIGMSIDLTERPFPPGPIDLRGRDW